MLFPLLYLLLVVKLCGLFIKDYQKSNEYSLELMGFWNTLVPVAMYVGAINFPGINLAPYSPAAQFSVLLLAVQSGITSWLSYGLLFIPAALALNLYSNVYATPSPGVMATSTSYTAVSTPRMVTEYVYYPVVAGASTLLASTVASSVGISLPHCSAFAAYGIFGAHVVRSIFFAVQKMIYPAPIVGQFLIGPNQLRSMREPIKDKIKSVEVHRQLGQEDSATLGSVEYVVFERPTQGRNLGTGDRVFEKQWIVYIGGNGEVFEANYQSPLSLANSLNANLILVNPRGVGGSSGKISSTSDLILDYATVIRHVRKQYHVADSRHILLLGHSIGGGVAAHLATSEELRDASLLLDRTFSSLTDAALGLSPVKHDGLVKALLPYAFGEFDVIGNYERIPHNRKLVIYHRNDQIIRFKDISLARLGAQRLGGVQYLIEAIGQDLSEDPHNCGFSSFGNNKELVARIKSIL